MPSIVDTTDLTRSKTRRRLFFFTSGLGLILLLVLRYVVIPWIVDTKVPDFTTTIDGILNSLIVAVSSSIMLGSLLYWLGAGEQASAEMRVIEPREIAEALKEALYDTNEWWYKGHTGRHFRSVSLPTLARHARSKNLSINISVQVLDPSDDSTCEYYAKYRQGLRTAEQDINWSSDRVRQELYATILYAYEMSGREPLLEFVIAVHRTVSVFRIDLSSKLAIITKEDPKEPALRCDAGTFFHSSYRQDLKMSRFQGTELDHRVRIGTFDSLSVSDVRDFFQSLGLFTSYLGDDTYIEKIIELARNAENPYP